MNILAGENTGTYAGPPVGLKEYGTSWMFTPSRMDKGEKDVIVVLMGGPFEDRAQYDGFPTRLANDSNKGVVSIVYRGSKKHDRDDEIDASLSMLDDDYNYDWATTGYEIYKLIQNLQEDG